jgi:hypothetical protein
LGRTKSFEHVDRGSMHATGHNDDLFPYKKYNGYKHIHTSSSKNKIKGGEGNVLDFLLLAESEKMNVVHTCQNNVLALSDSVVTGPE